MHSAVRKHVRRAREWLEELGGDDDDDRRLATLLRREVLHHSDLRVASACVDRLE